MSDDREGQQFQKFMKTPRGESYLWKTTHLNTAERKEEVKEGGKIDGGKRRRRETVVRV